MVRPKCQPNALPGFYGLLEESVESWEHVLADKLVYLPQSWRGMYTPSNSSPKAMLIFTGGSK